MTHEEMLHIEAQKELIMATAHIRAASTLEYYRCNVTLHREIEEALKAVEDLID